MLTNAIYEPYLEDVFKKYDINTSLRKAHFLAQLKHESGNFTVVSENLNYKKVERLVLIYKSPFDLNKNNRVDPEELEFAKKYISNPIFLANYVYANRMGNGPAYSGDGWRYRGKGLIQLTGKTTQLAYGKYAGIDLAINPDLLLTPKYALDSAGWFWSINKLNRWADLDDLKMVTKRINGGINGIEDRKLNLLNYKKLFNIK